MMITRATTLAACLMACALTPSLPAALIQFDLIGRAGPGLLAGNETGAVNGNFGSGGEIGAGIVFDDVSRDLTVRVGWGTGNGFTNLTGNATAMHIHTAPGPDFLNTAGGVTIGLDGLVGFNNSATNGSLLGTVNLTAAQATTLLSGAMYVNVHTTTNGGGEIRGNLSAVPEPTSLAMLGLVAVGLVGSRQWAKRRKQA